MTPVNYRWEFKKIMLHQFEAQMRPSLCFQIRTWNSMGGDKIQDDPNELQMGGQKIHAALVQGPNAPKSMFLDSNLDFHGW